MRGSASAHALNANKLWFHCTWTPDWSGSRHGTGFSHDRDCTELPTWAHDVSSSIFTDCCASFNLFTSWWCSSRVLRAWRKIQKMPSTLVESKKLWKQHFPESWWNHLANRTICLTCQRMGCLSDLNHPPLLRWDQANFPTRNHEEELYGFAICTQRASILLADPTFWVIQEQLITAPHVQEKHGGKWNWRMLLG